MVINGKIFRELRCKNDSCRKLIMYETLREGVAIYICPRCEATSEFRFNYTKAKEDMDQLIDMLKGGE